MQKDKNIPANPDKGTMLSQKTYEDFNKKRPTPNEIKKPPPFLDIPPSPNEDHNQIDHNQGENKSEGSE